MSGSTLLSLLITWHYMSLSQHIVSNRNHSVGYRGQTLRIQDGRRTLLIFHLVRGVTPFSFVRMRVTSIVFARIRESRYLRVLTNYGPLEGRPCEKASKKTRKHALHYSSVHKHTYSRDVLHATVKISHL